MIKQVAVYLRKSRDDNETIDTLSKHRDTLVALCLTSGWNYKLYEEIASGERIASRPVMQELLEAVEEGTYDAVVVMDIDRLGRGNNKDWGIIYESFCNHQTNTLIVTPQRTYDLTEDTDEMMVDFQSLFAKMEYKAIRKRLMRGKVAGAKQGLWTCAVPPYPYVTSVKKVLEVDMDKLKTYRMMVAKAVEGESLEEITKFLNDHSIPSPRGTLWSSSTVKRILCDEIHLGHIVYGKTKGDSRKCTFTKIDRENWIIAANAHVPCKTQEEHNIILRNIESRRTIPVAARARTHILSGLLHCGACGYRMTFKMSGSGYYCAICSHKLRNGTRCTMKGHKLDDEFYDAVYDAVFKVDEDVLREVEEGYEANKDTAVLIEGLQKELEKTEAILVRIQEAYETGDMEKPVYVQRKNIRNQEKQQILEKIQQLQSTVQHRPSTEEYIERIGELRYQWNNARTAQEKNKILHGFISRIDYYRDDSGIRLEATPH